MLGVLAWGKREGCCAQAEILVSDLHFPSVSSRSMREMKSVMIVLSAFTGRWVCSHSLVIQKKHEWSHVDTNWMGSSRAELSRMCQNVSLFTGPHPPIFLCFPHSGVSDSAPAGFCPVCLANLVSQSRQCHWRSNNIQYKSLIRAQGQNLPDWQRMKDETPLLTTYNAHCFFINIPSSFSITLFWQKRQHMI